MLTPRLVLVDIEPTDSVVKRYECLKESMKSIGLETSTNQTEKFRNFLFSGQREGVGDSFIVQEVCTQIQKIYRDCEMSGPFHVSVTI